MIRALLELGRVSNLPTVWTNCMAAWVVAGGGRVEAALWWVVLGASLVYIGGTAWNDAFDAAFDAEHRPARPVPSGRLKRSTVWAVGGVALAVGAGAMVFAGRVDPAFALLLLGAVLFYDYVHKRSAVGVWVMGLCRFLLYLAAATAVASDPALGPVAWLAGATGLYVVGLSLVARREALPAAGPSAGPAGGEGAGVGSAEVTTGGRQSGVPGAVILVLVPLAYASLHLSGLVRSSPERALAPLGVVLLLTAWVLFALRGLRKQGAAGAGRFVARALAGIVLIDAVVISTVDPRAGLVCLGIFALTLLAQRYVPAT